MKNYSILLLTIFILSCKKAPELNPETIRLNKVETFVYTNNSSFDFEYFVNHIDLFKPSWVDEYLYDSQARLVEKRHSENDQLYDTFTIEYAGDNISKISVTPATVANKGGFFTITSMWAGDSIITDELWPGGRVINSLYKLDVNNLPTYKHYDRANKPSDTYLYITYDEHGNIKTYGPAYGYTTAYEYDITQFNPYACSYNMRMFNVLTTFDPFLFPHDYPISTNWVSQRRVGDHAPIGPAATVLETNSIGYATKVRYVTNSVRRFYYN